MFGWEQIVEILQFIKWASSLSTINTAHSHEIQLKEFGRLDSMTKKTPNKARKKPCTANHAG